MPQDCVQSGMVTNPTGRGSNWIARLSVLEVQGEESRGDIERIEQTMLDLVIFKSRLIGIAVGAGAAGGVITILVVKLLSK